MINTDSMFFIGSEHKVNQDYVLSNERKGIEIVGKPFLLLSDGCSGSPHTDFGSRLLVSAAKSNLYRSLNEEDYLSRTIFAAEIFCKTIGLNNLCLNATLLTATIEQEGFRVSMCGDGVVAVREEHGLRVFERKFTSSAPYYLRYELYQLDKNAYMEEFGKKLQIKEFWIPDNGDVEEKTENHLLNYYSPFWTSWFSFSSTKFVAIMSDGISSFEKDDANHPLFGRIKNQKYTSVSSVPITDIVKPLLSFKNFHGEFVHRRVKRALSEFVIKGIRNTDDVSIGVMGDFPLVNGDGS